MADTNYLNYWAKSTANDAAMNGGLWLGGKALSKTVSPVMRSAGTALSVMPHPAARIAGKVLTFGSKIAPAAADWGAFGVKAAPFFSALDTYQQYGYDKEMERLERNSPKIYASLTNPNVNYGVAGMAGLLGFLGADALPIFKKNKLLKKLFNLAAATGLGYAGYKAADNYQMSNIRNQYKQAKLTYTDVYKATRGL